MPRQNSAIASVMKPGASAAAKQLKPQPMKNTTIMVRRLQRSASQPAGKEKIPNAKNDAVPISSNSP